jgi:hypothetical protein
MPAVRPHPVIASLALVLTVVAGAFLAAFGADRLLGLGPVAVSAIVAVIVAGAFGWRLADGLLAFGVAILLADTVEHWTTLDLRYVDEIAIPLLIVVGLLAHRARLVPPRPGVREAALGVLVIAGIVSSLAAEVPASIWIPGLGLLLKGFAFFYLVLVLPLRLEELRRIAGAFFVIGLAIIGIGLLQFVDPDLARSVFGLPPFDQQRGSIQVVHSLFTHPALYGWLAVFLSLFLFARFTVLREWWALALSLALGAASLLSGRRAPIIGAVAGLAVGVAHQITAGRPPVRVWASVAASVVVLAVLSATVWGDFWRTTTYEYLDPPEVMAEVFADQPDSKVIQTIQPRVALYLGSLAIAADGLPLGAGIGRFASHMSREAYSPLYERYGLHEIGGLSPADPSAVTDTFWPMILGETGIVGLGAAAVFFVSLFIGLWRAARRVMEPARQAFVLGALLVFAEALVRSLASPLFVAPPIAFIAFGVAGMALAVGHDDASTLGAATTTA